jgi:hypothetical protein
MLRLINRVLKTRDDSADYGANGDWPQVPEGLRPARALRGDVAAELSERADTNAQVLLPSIRVLVRGERKYNG